MINQKSLNLKPLAFFFVDSAIKARNERRAREMVGDQPLFRFVVVLVVFLDLAQVSQCGSGCVDCLKSCVELEVPTKRLDEKNNHPKNGER